jgi:fructose-1,6-bisphosphatase/inositol monophosphatase family enzyme
VNLPGGLREGDPERVVALMQETAEAELLPRLGRLASSDVREKRPGDIVTVADEASERRLAAGLARILPGVPVVGEEGVAAEPGLISQIGEADAAWIVDPLDGTANFAAGRDDFTMIVALASGGTTVAGWILHPRTGRMATAFAGAGAWLDGKPVSLARDLPLKRMHGFTGWRLVRTIRDDAARRGVLDRIGKLGSRNCAGLEYIEMMAGLRHFSLYRWTKPWDHAAGALMMVEAGGAALAFDGAPYRPTQPGEAGIVTAPDAARCREIQELLLGRPAPLLDRARTAAP